MDAGLCPPPVCLPERARQVGAARLLRPGAAQKLRSALKDAVKEAGLKGTVRVNEAGCLNQCEHAAVVVVYPEAIWYGFVHPRDAEEIVQEHLIRGRPVERLRLPDSCINTKHCPHKP